jgi:hypothetical protein
VSRPSRFRAWLVERVSEAKLRLPKDQKTLEDQARYLGVQPDVLEEAATKRSERIEASGHQVSRRDVYAAGHEIYTRVVALYMPPEIRRLLQGICDVRRISMHDLERAATHTLLLSGKLPSYSGKGWFYKGKRYGVGTGKVKERLKEQFRISVGAYIALTRRAEINGATATGLIRGALIDVLEGRTKQLVYVDTSAMYNDPERYLKPAGD